MKSILKRTLVIIMTISMMLGCMPLNVFADSAKAGALSVYGQLYFGDINSSDKNNDGIPETPSNFPAIPLVLRDWNEEVIAETTAKSDGTFEFVLPNHLTEDDVSEVYFGIKEGTAYALSSNYANNLDPGEHNDYWFQAEGHFDTNGAYNIFGKLATNSYIFVNEIVGNAIITKTEQGNSNNVPVAGAKYEIYYLGTPAMPLTATKIATEKTNSNGQITLNNLKIGTYQYVEIESDDASFNNNYFVNVAGNNTFEIQEGKTTPVNTTDEAKCTAILIKKDQNGNVVKGATFELRKPDGTVVKTQTTDEEGKIVINELHYGNYYFIEIQAPNGYEYNDETKYEITLNGNTKTAEVTAINVSWPEVSFEKVDASNTNIKLPGASLSIYEEGNANPVHTWTSGTESFRTKLKPGRYYVVENSAPTNYKKMEGKLYFDVLSLSDENYEPLTVQIKNEKHTIDIDVSKIDGTNNEYLIGAIFELNGPIRITWTTTNTTYTMKNLVPGTYTLKETVVPEGYIGSSDITITIGENCSFVKITKDGITTDITSNRSIQVKNTPIVLDIEKYGTTQNDRMYGVEMMLYRKQDGIWKEYQKFTINGTTKSFYAIPTGEYMLVENVPQNYKLGTINGNAEISATKNDSNSILFTIRNNANNKLEIQNELIYNTITILKEAKKFDSDTTTKYDINDILYTVINLKDNTEPLAGATFAIKAKFDIYDPSGKTDENGNRIILYHADEVIQSMTTKDDGMVKFENLLIGEYIIEETNAPIGYIKAEPQTIIIDENYANTIHKVTDENEQIKISVNKTCSETGDGIPYTIYGIYYKTGNMFFSESTLVATLTTEFDGYAEFVGYLPKGEYYIKEIKARYGYIADTQQYIIDFTNPADDDGIAEFHFDFKNAPIRASVEKLDKTTGESIEGAILELIDEYGNIYERWTTKNNVESIRYQFYAIPAGTYILREVYTPDGYKTANDMTIVIKESNNQNGENHFVMYDERITGSITVTKTEKDNVNKPLKNAEFRLLLGDNEIARAKTNANGQLTFNNLAVANYKNGKIDGAIQYTIEEVKAPDGYLISTASKTVIFDITETSTDKRTSKDVSFENDYTKIGITKTYKKVNADGTTTVVPLADAKLALYLASDIDMSTQKPINGANVLYEWTTTEDAYIINRLHVGQSYAIYEIAAPDGYIRNDKVVIFTVKDTIELQDDITIENDFTKVIFQKLDIRNNNYVIGATMHLYTESAYLNNGQPLEIWETTETDHRVDALPTGIYYLVEYRVPEGQGYIKAAPIKFEVKNTSEPQYITMYDDVTKIDVYKVDIDNRNKKLTGATLTLYRAEDVINGVVKDNARIIDSWVSTENAKRIEALPQGEYTIVETIAPDGYVITGTTTFTIQGNEIEAKEIFVENDYTKFSFTKYYTEKGTNRKVMLGGVVFEIYAQDANGNAVGEVLYRFTTKDNEPTEITHIPVGNYILREISVPDGFIKSETDVPFTILSTPNVQDGTMENEYITIYIKKLEYKIDAITGLWATDENGNIIREYVADATLGLYKTEDIDPNTGLPYENAEAIDIWTTEGYSINNSNYKHFIYRIPAGNYTIVELKAPDGYLRAENKNIVVKQTSGTQVFEMLNDYTKVEIHKVDIDGKYVENAVLGIYNVTDIDKYGNIIGDAKPIRQWTTTDTSHREYRLPYGDYAIVELSVPDGYLKAETEYFSINASTATEPSPEHIQVNITDDFIKVNIHKVEKGNRNQYVGMATLELYKEVDAPNGRVQNPEKMIATWVTDDSAKYFEKLTPGKYVIIETHTPSGYVGSYYTFTVDSTNEIQNIYIENDFTKLNVSKVEKKNNAQEFVVGATLSIYYESDIINGKVIRGAIPYASWQTADMQTKLTHIPVGTYYLVEDITPDGYVTAEPIKFTITDDSAKKPVEIVMIDDFTKVNIYKQEKTTTNNTTFVKGAVLEIYEASKIVDGKISDNARPYTTVVTTDKAIELTHIPVGDYVIIETFAPAGYVRAPHTKFTVTNSGEIVDVYIYDGYTTLTVEKLDKRTQEPLAGAVLRLIDSNGDIYAEWTSTTEPKVFEKIPVGTYILKELSAPDGYFVAGDIEIIIEETESMHNASIENDCTKIKIEKISALTDKLLIGAEMGLYNKSDIDANGQPYEDAKPIATWLSTDEAYEQFALPVGEYAVVELSAPVGYAKAETEYFSIKSAETVLVQIIDDYTEVSISKKSSLTNDYLNGATLAIYNANEYDALKENAEPVKLWTTDSGEKIFELLPLGDYVLVELTAPTGYVKASPIRFSITDENHKIKLEMVNQHTSVTVKKLDENGEFLPNATLAIYSKSDIVNGKIVDGAQCFAQWITGNEKTTHTLLPLGDYVVVELSAPDGYVRDTMKEFTISEDNHNAEVVLQNFVTTLIINKVDINGEHLSGATMQLVDSNGNVYAEWVSDGTEKIFKKIPIGTYTLIELNAPNGYVVADKMTIDVVETTEIQEYTMTNDHTKVIINKVDEKGNYLAGAILQLIDKNGNVIEEWTTTENGKLFEKLSIDETYYIKELYAPDGYIRTKNFEFVVENTASTIQHNVVNKQTVISISKLDENGKHLIGATMQLIDKDGNPVAEWITDGTEKIFKGLAIGKYTLVEVSAPNGYATAPKMLISVEETDRIQKFGLLNTPTTIHISKVDENGNLLADATLKLVDSEGNVIAEWTTDGNIKEFIKLNVGETYTIVEVSAPNGYVTAKPVEFTVKDTADTQNVVVENKTTVVEISKTDSTGNALADAILKLLDNEGNIIAEWNTTEGAKQFIKLTVGETYRLVEVSAPNGYALSDAIEFTVEDTAEVQKVVMVNHHTVIHISKVDENGDLLAGATLKLVDSEGNVIAEWTTDGSIKEFVKLNVGETYTLVEISAPNGYVIAESLEFKVEDTKDIQEIKFTNKNTTIHILKIDENGTPIAGATLQLVDSSNNVIAEWVSTTEAKVFTKLIVGETYKIVEVSAPDGYIKSDDITFIVEETDEIQTIKIINVLDVYDIIINKVNTKNEFVSGATLVLTDAEGNVVATWISGNEGHQITGLTPGIYTLTETASPDGYVIAKPITFTLLEGGLTPENELTIVLTNVYTEVSISKLVADSNEHLIGAVLRVIDNKGNIIDEWTTDGNAHIIYGLKVGKYTLIEVSAPNGYLVADAIEFEIKADETTEIVMYDVFIEQEQPDNPQTGDNSNLGLYVVLMLTSLFGIVAIIVSKKKLLND